MAEVPARRLLAAGALALFAVRAALSLVRSGPVLMADEAGYLAHARVLAGGGEFDMGASPFYRGGYSLFLAPVNALDVSPELTYHLVLVVNAALAASLVPLLYLLLTRCFEISPAAAVGGAVAGAAFPTVTAVSQIAISENLLFPLTTAWLLGAGMLVRARQHQIACAVGVGLGAGLLWTTHGRMIVAVAVTLALLVLLAARQRISTAAAAAGSAAMGAALVAGRLMNDFLADRSYDGRRGDELSTTLDSFDGIGDFLSVARNLIGSSWYLMAATFGVLGLVLAWEAPRLRQLVRGDIDPRGLAHAVSLVTLAGLLLVSAVFFVEAERADHIAYGRYVEPVVPALLAIGIAGLTRRAGRLPARLVLVALAGLTLATAALRSGFDASGDANRWNGAALPFVTSDLGPAVIVGGGIVAVGGAIVLLAAARRWPAGAWLAAIALFVPVSAFTEGRLVLRAEHDRYPAGWSSPERTVERLGGGVAFDTAADDRFAVKAYQWFLPDREVELFDSREASPPEPLFYSSGAWPRRNRGTAVRAVWRDPARDQVLWRLDGARLGQ